MGRILSCRRFKRCYSKGFVLIETIFSLLISFIVLFVIHFVLMNIRNIKVNINPYTDIILATKQLSQDLLLGTIEEVNENSIVYKINDDEYKIYLNNNTLIREPGYLVYLYDVDHIVFYDDELLIMEVTRNNEIYKQTIGVSKKSY